MLNKNVFIRVERLKKRKVYTNIKDRIMTKEEYQKKINELKEQKYALNAQIEQVNKEF